jgi:CRP-like cAMP-binding protein
LEFAKNAIVAQLPAIHQSRLLNLCQHEDLAAGHVLWRADGGRRDVYFPDGATVALVASLGDGQGMAVGLTGHEGALGLQFALGLPPGHLVPVVQTAGKVWRAPAAEVGKLLQKHPPVLLAFAQYLWSTVNEVGRMAAFAQTHDLLARLAGWILMSEQRSGFQPLHLTHDHLSNMLGVRRASVTLASQDLKSRGLIDYTRGRLVIRDRAGLQAVSCGLFDASAR